MTILADTFNHLIHNILPAAADYEAAEELLTRSYDSNPLAQCWNVEARAAKRQAAELAIGIDGLTDRAAHGLSIEKKCIRIEVAALCFWPGSTNLRRGSFERVRGVANAYKHKNLNDPSLPITSDNGDRKRDRDRKRDTSDIPKSGEFSVCPYCQ